MLARWLIVAGMVAGGLADLRAGVDAELVHPVTLQLKWHHQFQFAGYYAAQARGFYKEAGLDVKILEGGQTVPPIPAVLSGAAQFGVGDSGVLVERLNGRPLVVCAAIFQHSPYVILSRRDRNIRTPHDLLGARLMLSDDQGAAQFRAMMKNQQIDPGRITIVPHTWDLADLVERRVDAISAYSTYEPVQLRARGVESSMLRAEDYGVDFYGDTLFTTEAELGTHPKEAAAFVRASLKGWEYALRHPEEIADLILGMKSVAARGLSRDMLLDEAKEMRTLIQPDFVEIGHMSPARWEKIAATFATQGAVPARFSLAGFVFDPLRADLATLRQRTWSVLLVGLLAAGLLLLWNVQIRRRVRERTHELQASEERFRQLTENIDEVFWITDARKGQMIYVSPAYATVWGRTCESLYAAPGNWIEAIHPADRDRVREAAHTKQFQGSYNEVFRIVRPDGVVRWIHDRAFPVRNAAGEVYRIAGVSDDITDQKRVADALLESRNKLQTIFDAAPVAILSLDPEGRVLEWNAGASRIFGWTKEEAIGRYCPTVPPDGRTGYEAMIKRVMSSGWQTGMIYDRQNKNGEKILASINAAPLQDATGRPTGIMVILENITERRRTEEELRRSEDRFRSIFEQAGIGIALVGLPDSRIMRCNQALADMFGYSVEECCRLTVEDVSHPEDQRADVEQSTLMLAGKQKRFQMEKRYRRKDGEQIWGLLTSTLVRDSQGKPQFVIGMVEEITDRKRAEEGLRNAGDQLRALVARLNTVREEEAKRIARELHDDLGQHLTALNMEITALATMPARDQFELPGRLAKMHGIVNHTIEVVQKISGELRLGQLDLLGLPAAIEWYVQEFQRRSALRCQFSQTGETVPLSDIVATAVFRVVQEALTNVARHAQATAVEVALTTGPGRLRVEVRDNGRGITPAQLADRTAYGLLGMRERIEGLGGEITIHGAPGHGTTVVVIVPIAG